MSFFTKKKRAAPVRSTSTVAPKPTKKRKTFPAEVKLLAVEALEAGLHPDEVSEIVGAIARFDGIEVDGGVLLTLPEAILFDFGAEVMSYGCDITRCFTFGKPSRIYKEVYTAVAQAHKISLVPLYK